MMESLERIVKNSPQAAALTMGAATFMAGGNYNKAHAMIQSDVGSVLRQISTAAVMYGGIGDNPGAMYSGFRHALSNNPAMSMRNGIYGSGMLTNAMAEMGTVALNKELFSSLTGASNRNITRGFGSVAMGGMLAEHGMRGVDFSQLFDLKSGSGGAINVSLVKGGIDKLKNLIADTSKLMAAVSDLTGSQDMRELFRQTEVLTGQSVGPTNLPRLTSAVTQFRNSMASSGMSTAEQYVAAERMGKMIEGVTGSIGFGAAVARGSGMSHAAAFGNLTGYRKMLSESGVSMDAPSRTRLQEMEAQAAAGILGNADQGPVIVDAMLALQNGSLDANQSSKVNNLLGQLQSGTNMTPEQRSNVMAQLRSALPQGRGVATEFGVQVGMQGLNADSNERLSRVIRGMDRGSNIQYAKPLMRNIFGGNESASDAATLLLSNFDASTVQDVIAAGGKIDLARGTSDLEKRMRETAINGGMSDTDMRRLSESLLSSGDQLTKSKMESAVAFLSKTNFFSGGNMEADYKMTRANRTAALERLKFSGSASAAGNVVNEDSFISEILKGYHGVGDPGELGSRAVALAIQQSKNAGGDWKMKYLGGYLNRDGGLEVSLNNLETLRDKFKTSGLDFKTAIGLGADATDDQIQKHLSTPAGLEKLMSAMEGGGLRAAIDSKNGNAFSILDRHEAETLTSDLQKRYLRDSIAPLIFGNGAGAAAFVGDGDMTSQVNKARAMDSEGAKILDAFLGGGGIGGNSAEQQRAIFERASGFAQVAMTSALNLGGADKFDSDDRIKKLTAAAEADPALANILSNAFRNAAEAPDIAITGGAAQDPQEIGKVRGKAIKLADKFRELASSKESGGGKLSMSGTLRVEDKDKLRIFLDQIPNSQ